jgi:hypothetical protein
MIENPINALCEQEVAYETSLFFKLNVLKRRLQWKSVRPFAAAHLLVGLDPETPIDTAFQGEIRLRLLPGLVRPRRPCDWHARALKYAGEVNRTHRLLVDAYGAGATDAREWMKRAGELGIKPPWRKFLAADRNFEAWLFDEPLSSAAFRVSQRLKAKARNEQHYGLWRQKVFAILDSCGEEFPDACFTKGDLDRKRPRRLADTRIVDWILDSHDLPELPNGQEDGGPTVARYVKQWFAAHPHVRNSARPDANL